MNAEFPTKEEFRARLTSTFHTTDAAGNAFDLELLSVDEIVSSDRHENFTLLFRAPVDTPGDQRIYDIAHPELGEMAVFLVPVSRDNEGLYFEAVFNLFS